MPELSYIIPAYNAERTLDATVRSVLTQTGARVEAVIVDDGSTDGTRHIAGALAGPRVRLVSRDNAGLAAARNTGLRGARAPVVCFLDADDVVLPTHAARLLGALGDADAAACAYRFTGPSLEDLGWVVPVDRHDAQLPRIAEVNRLAVGGVVLRVSSLSRLGGPVFRESLPVHEDWDMFLRMALAGAAWGEVVRDALFLYRLRPDSMSTDLVTMWRVGLEVMARAGDAPPHARRDWTLRHLARAIARDDRSLVRGALDVLGPLGADDVGVLAGSLRWALARQDLCGPGSWESRAPAWRARVARSLAGESPLPELLAGLGAGPARWREILARAAAQLDTGSSLVIYGLGRNGREALAASEAMGLGVLAADDSPGAHADLPRIDPALLGPSHVVVVTPESRRAMVDRLVRQGVRRIVTPDQPALRAA